MRIRLDRYLADLGWGTRKEIKSMISRGRVSVNGETAVSPDRKTDTICEAVSVDGCPQEYRRYTVVMLNKPAGVLSATEDGRDTTAADLLTGRYAAMGLKPAGRLDKDAVGLLLMTNDGALIHGIISPARKVPKTYYVELSDPLPAGSEEAFREGIVLDDGYKCLGAELKYTAGALSAEVTVFEGKFHQVKRMFGALGSTVLYLKRIGEGSLILGDTLAEGCFRELTREEIDLLYEETKTARSERG